MVETLAAPTVALPQSRESNLETIIGQTSNSSAEGNPPVLQDFPKTHFTPPVGQSTDNPQPVAFSSGTVETIRLKLKSVSALLKK